MKVFRKVATAVIAASVFAAPLVAQDSKDAPRIVTLGGSITEIVYALGAGKNIVGVDISSHVPVDVEKLPKVGVFRAISAEGVLGLKPSLVVGTEDAGPLTALAQLRSAGVSVKLAPAGETVAGALAKIRSVAAALDEKAKGEALASKVSGEVDAALRDVAKAKTKPRVLFVYARGGGTLLVGGLKNPAESMIGLAGGKNAITHFKGFKPLTAEAVVSAQPDVIVIPQHGLTAVGGIDGLMKLPGIALTPAGKSRRVIAMDDELLLGFGPRLGQGIRELAVGLHPELK